MWVSGEATADITVAAGTNWSGTGGGYCIGAEV